MIWSDQQWFVNRDRLVLARWYEGASRREIADELDVSEARARQIITEARKRQADRRRAQSPTARFFYTERFGDHKP